MITLLCLLIVSTIFWRLGLVMKQVYAKKSEEKELQKEYKLLLNAEEKLKAEALKLQDTAYVAKYARERFLYSKNNEYIIKMKDD